MYQCLNLLLTIGYVCVCENLLVCCILYTYVHVSTYCMNGLSSRRGMSCDTLPISCIQYLHTHTNIYVTHMHMYLSMILSFTK